MNPARRRARAAALLLALATSACTSGARGAVESGAGGAATATARATASTAAPPRSAAPVAPLGKRVRPDVLVVSAKPLTPAALVSLRVAGRAGFVELRWGRVKLGGAMVGIAGVDPSRFRAFAPDGTAESDQVWQAVARGELAVAHDTATARRVELGATLPVRGKAVVPLRVGVLATTDLPDVAAVVADDVATALGLPAANAAVLSAGSGDASALAKRVREIVPGATTHLLTQPPTPFAFLRGNGAQSLGGFTYRYFEDGTIEPDARWVAANIVRAKVPIIGWVTCHRRMVPQLRSALAEVEAAGLGTHIRTYDGCYVPRFIERDPSHAISLHTWGIAIDLDAATNYRGIRGTMHPEIVRIFKKWGFRWGGDWSYTDPMHFELGALIS